MNILGIAGKKQSGKNTTANYLNGVVLHQSGSIKDFAIDIKGELNVLTSFSDGSEGWGVLDIYRKDKQFVEAAEETIWPFVKNYSFADSLKQVAVDLFELKPEQVWGTDEQKNSLTHLLWENMPGVTTEVTPQDPVNEEVAGRLGKYYEKVLSGVVYHKPGPMTGREFLQFFGTEIGRRMHAPIWINSTINKIISEGSGLAIITDVRFPDEVRAIQKAGGKVIRLTRQVFNDNHASETSLDGYTDFDLVVHNDDLSIEHSCKIVEKFARQNNIL